MVGRASFVLWHSLLGPASTRGSAAPKLVCAPEARKADSRPTMTAPTLANIPIERILELVDRFDTRGPRYTSYPTVPAWQGQLPSDAHDASLAACKRAARPIAVYLHLPFCAQRCWYCGCNAVVTGRQDRMERYVTAVEREIALLGERFGSAMTCDQLHLGGGTPTHLPVGLLESALDRLSAQFPPSEQAERSVEVDPRNCSDEHLAALVARGFRRISIGVQDVDDQVQKAVGRVQPLALIRSFVERARKIGFVNVNIDLIYGLPLQTQDSWDKTLNSMAELRPDRLACFGFAYLPKRMKHQKAIDATTLPSAELRLRLLLQANRFFTDNGYQAIGMDHFARPEDELSRARRDGRLWRSFMGYTTIRGLELIGIGCSSISELQSLFCQNETNPDRYAELVEAGPSAVVRGHQLDDDDRYRKELISELMCNLEIRPSMISERSGLPVPEGIDEALVALAPYEQAGLVEPIAQGYRVTEVGQLFLRNLAMPFDRYLTEDNRKVFSRTV